MTETILSALITLAGTLIGSILGAVASAKLTNFRLTELERKAADQEDLAERVAKLEVREEMRKR